MAVDKQPILKRCRYLGISPMVMGVSKESNRNPGANKRKKVSEYGTQLKEKQKLRFIYGVGEKQFAHMYETASKMEGKTGENLIELCERRLDNVVWRMGLSMTRRESRQLVNHRHFTVNGQRVNIPSYRVKVGDTIALYEDSRKSKKFQEIIEANAKRPVPMWLEFDAEKLEAKVVRMPNRDDIDYEVQENLIVEYYSK